MQFNDGCCIVPWTITITLVFADVARNRTIMLDDQESMMIVNDVCQVFTSLSGTGVPFLLISKILNDSLFQGMLYLHSFSDPIIHGGSLCMIWQTETNAFYHAGMFTSNCFFFRCRS